MTRITAVRGGTLLDADHEQVGDLVIEDDVIVQVGGRFTRHADVEVDAAGCLVTPGLVQTHVHLCQTAFSGLAEDLDVMAWLDRWIWPLEQHLDATALGVSARLGVAEMLLTGTTSFLSMETALHTDAAFEAAADLGVRATIGKAIMDRREPGTRLEGDTGAAAWADLLHLYETWHGRDGGRLRLAVSPRAPSAASDAMWADVLELANRKDLIVHTHVSENRGQSAKVTGANGLSDVRLLHRLGALGRRSVLAHCVWLDDEERALLAETGTTVAHCPTANLKLGSGVADVPALLAAGVNVTLGTDGAACNNTLDLRAEAARAAVLHRRKNDPTAVGSARALAFATRNGATALGYGQRGGALRPGMLADVAVFDAPQFFPGTGEAAADHLIYAGSLVRAKSVLVGGRLVVEDFALTRGDVRAIRGAAARLRAELLQKVG